MDREEGVVWTEGSLVPGVTTWRHLLLWKTGCPSAGCDGREHYTAARQPASFGFLCVTDTKDGHAFTCPGRHRKNRVRPPSLSESGIL